MCTYGLDKHVMTSPLNKPFICATCHRSFRRTQDIASHEYTTTHPIGKSDHIPGQHLLMMAGFKSSQVMYVRTYVYMYVCMHVCM